MITLTCPAFYSRNLTLTNLVATCIETENITIVID